LLSAEDALTGLSLIIERVPKRKSDDCEVDLAVCGRAMTRHNQAFKKMNIKEIDLIQLLLVVVPVLIHQKYQNDGIAVIHSN
jgi:hypothetical protein